MHRLDVTDLGGSDSRVGRLQYLISGTGGGWRVGAGVGHSFWFRKRHGSNLACAVTSRHGAAFELCGTAFELRGTASSHAAQPSTSHGDADPKQIFNMKYIMNS